MARKVASTKASRRPPLTGAWAEGLRLLGFGCQRPCTEIGPLGIASLDWGSHLHLLRVCTECDEFIRHASTLAILAVYATPKHNNLPDLLRV